MREGSGWTYQQIADHEGVEIGTIETLLWRARQALEREFAVVSESKEALAGFLVATGALIRRTVFRTAQRSAAVHHSSGGEPARCATPWQASPSPAQRSPRHSLRHTHCRALRAARHRHPVRLSLLRLSPWARLGPVRRTVAARGHAPALAARLSDRAAARAPAARATSGKGGAASGTNGRRTPRAGPLRPRRRARKCVLVGDQCCHGRPQPGRWWLEQHTERRDGWGRTGRGGVTGGVGQAVEWRDGRGRTGREWRDGRGRTDEWRDGWRRTGHQRRHGRSQRAHAVDRAGERTPGDIGSGSASGSGSSCGTSPTTDDDEPCAGRPRRSGPKTVGGLLGG